MIILELYYNQNYNFYHHHFTFNNYFLSSMDIRRVKKIKPFLEEYILLIIKNYLKLIVIIFLSKELLTSTIYLNILSYNYDASESRMFDNITKEIRLFYVAKSSRKSLNKMAR